MYTAETLYDGESSLFRCLTRGRGLRRVGLTGHPRLRTSLALLGRRGDSQRIAQPTEGEEGGPPIHGDGGKRNAGFSWRFGVFFFLWKKGV